MVASMLAVPFVRCSLRRRPAGSDRRLTLDSQILAEQFYFFTVVIMWLIHVGFMAYEAGAASPQERHVDGDEEHPHHRRRHAEFYYFGWYIYGCFEHGGPAQGHAGPGSEFPGFCGATAPWAARWARTSRTTSARVFFLAFLLFSWTTASIMSGRAHRAGAPLGLPDPRRPPRLGRLDHGRRLGLERRRLADRRASDSTTRSPSLVVHGVAGAFTLGVLLNLGPRIGKYDTGRAGPNLPAAQHRI